MSGNKLKIAIDVVLAITLVLLYNTRTVTGLSFHEWAGILIAAGFILHIAVSWDWVVAVTTKFLARTTPRARLLYVLDVLVLLLMGWTILSGVFISRIVLPGLAQGAAPIFRQTHVPISWLTLLVIGLHLGLHWQWVMDVCRRLLSRPRATAPVTIALRVLAGVTLIAGLSACVATDVAGQVGRLVGATPAGPGEHRGPGKGEGRGGGGGRGPDHQGAPGTAPGPDAGGVPGGQGGGHAGDATTTWQTLVLGSGVMAASAVPAHYADRLVAAGKRRRRRAANASA